MPCRICQRYSLIRKYHHSTDNTRYYSCIYCTDCTSIFFIKCRKLTKYYKCSNYHPHNVDFCHDCYYLSGQYHLDKKIKVLDEELKIFIQENLMKRNVLVAKIELYTIYNNKRFYLENLIGARSDVDFLLKYAP